MTFEENWLSRLPPTIYRKASMCRRLPLTISPSGVASSCDNEFLTFEEEWEARFPRTISPNGVAPMCGTDV